MKYIFALNNAKTKNIIERHFEIFLKTEFAFFLYRIKLKSTSHLKNSFINFVTFKINFDSFRKGMT